MDTDSSPSMDSLSDDRMRLLKSVGWCSECRTEFPVEVVIPVEVVAEMAPDFTHVTAVGYGTCACETKRFLGVESDDVVGLGVVEAQPSE